MEFSPSPRRTVGVEWELQLLDPVSLDLMDGIVPLMEFYPDSSFVKPEFIQCSVELNSKVSETAAEAIDHLEHLLRGVLARCSELEMSVCGAGTHPFCRRLAVITPLPRYQEIEKESGYVGHTQLTFGTHVHVGMGSGDEAMRAMTRLTSVLPVFLALAANSPFWRGHDTGFAAYRHRILAATRSYGLPPRFSDWCQFQSFFDAAVKSRMIDHFKDIHWDIRPNPELGTLEIRTMDAASDSRSLWGQVAFARSMAACMATAADREVDGVLPADLPHWVQKENYYRASHQGLDAHLICDAEGRTRPLRDLAGELVEFCAPTAEEIGESQGLEITRETLAADAGCGLQRTAYREARSTRQVAAKLAQLIGVLRLELPNICTSTDP